MIVYLKINPSKYRNRNRLNRNFNHRLSSIKTRNRTKYENHHRHFLLLDQSQNHLITNWLSFFNKHWQWSNCLNRISQIDLMRTFYLSCLKIQICEIPLDHWLNIICYYRKLIRYLSLWIKSIIVCQRWMKGSKCLKRDD